MITFLTALVFSALAYLALTAGSGSIVFWSAGELISAAVLSVPAALLVSRLFSAAGFRPGTRALNPARWLLLAFYAIGPLFLSMAKANVDVAARVITGRIRPGIVRIETGMKKDSSIMLLANSVTLTPGTLCVDVDEDGSLYVHCINLKKKDPSAEDVCGPLLGWTRRVSE